MYAVLHIRDLEQSLTPDNASPLGLPHLLGLPPLRPLETSRAKLDALFRELKKISEKRKTTRLALSETIAFLASYGISSRQLEAAQIRGKSLNISPERALFAAHVLTEEVYLDLFAEEFGYDRVTPATRLIPPLSPCEAANRHMAKIKPERNADGSLQQLTKSAIVPEPESLRFLMSGKAQRYSSGVQLASAKEFQALLLADASSGLLQEITGGNFKNAGQISASAGLSYGHKITFYGVALATVLFVLFASKWGILILTICASFIFLSVISVRLRAISAYAQSSEMCAFMDDDNLPVYTVLVALYKEDRVITKLCKSLMALDYPPEKLDIKLLLEHNDCTTQRAIDRLQLPCQFSTLVLPKGNPRTKPRALNAGLAFARGELVCVFDAEDEPEPDQLRKAAVCFAAGGRKLACLQASLVPDNCDDGLLQGLFALEYAVLFDVVKNGLSNLEFPMPLGGTSNHFRKSILEDIGGWDAWNVTEDAELGLRLARMGYKTECLHSCTFEEAPPTLKSWFNQRRRWSKGWMQTAITHTTHPVQDLGTMGSKRFFMSLTMTIGTILCLLVFPLGLFSFMARCLNDGPFFKGEYMQCALDTLTLLIAFSGFMALFLPPVIALRKRKLQRLWFIVPLMPFYLIGITLASWVAAYDLMVRPYHWIKTEHGFAKTSNRRYMKLHAA